MNPPTAKKEREQELPIVELRDINDVKAFTCKLSKEMHNTVKALAAQLDMHDWEVFSLLVAEGLKAVVGSPMESVARITMPTAFDWIAQHTPWREAKKKRLHELLKEAKVRIEVEKK